MLLMLKNIAELQMIVQVLESGSRNVSRNDGDAHVPVSRYSMLHEYILSRDRST